MLKLLLKQLDICAFEFTTDTILVAFDRGGITNQSTKLERNFVLGSLENLHFYSQIISF
jgi:hypothetical protein